MPPYLEKANKEGREVFFIVEDQTNSYRGAKPKESDSWESHIVPTAIYLIFLYLIYRTTKKQTTQPTQNQDEEMPADNHYPYLVYNGNELKFTNEILEKVLGKYNPYFNTLNELNKIKFIQRLQKFIAAKTFVIHSSEGFREMPILISAAAIQITFGLEKYLLERFSIIAIYPEEYIKTDPLRVLMGNVQGNTISLSWKHFLTDYSNPTDGKNVGLHEMAHALQLQNMLPGKKADHEFLEDFQDYDFKGTDWLLAEQMNQNSMYDSYSLKNKDEFWAASIELYFERPAELKIRYPQLYASLCDVLNQDPTSVQMQFR